MNERQKEIASQAIAQIVQDAAVGRDALSDEKLKTVAVNAAKAMSAAFAELDKVS